MKTILSVTLVLVAAAFIAVAQTTKFIKIAWDYDAIDMSTNLTFKLYQSTNITTPLSNWTVLTNIVGTNLQVRIQVIKGRQFFAMTASNMWGESDFSEVLALPPLPRSTNNNLRITEVE